MADIYRSSYYEPSYTRMGSRRDHYGHPGYANFVEERSPAHSRHYHAPSTIGLHSSSVMSHDHVARRAWPTEIPVKVYATICCEECRMRIETSLRHVEGVHDVGIVGRGNAMVTVTGTAKPRRILQEIRQISQDAELWTEEHDQHTHTAVAYHGNH